MALIDVKLYFRQVENLWLESKADLADFEQALKDGHITEDQLENVKADFEVIDTNYQRLLYVMWLYSIPNRKSKRAKQKYAKDLIEKFSLAKSDAEAVEAENINALEHLRAEIKKLKVGK